ncbi:hypothetical protein CerSpe_204390 [Prunus speciosa]
MEIMGTSWVGRRMAMEILKCKNCSTVIALAEDFIAVTQKERHGIFLKCVNFTEVEREYLPPSFSILAVVVKCASCQSRLGYRIERMEDPAIEFPKEGHFLMHMHQLETEAALGVYSNDFGSSKVVRTDGSQGRSNDSSALSVSSYCCHSCGTSIALASDRIWTSLID